MLKIIKNHQKFCFILSRNFKLFAKSQNSLIKSDPQNEEISNIQEINKNVSEFQRFFHLRQAIENSKILADKITTRKIKQQSFLYIICVSLSIFL